VWLGTGRAPGKVILFGEHAVVYGQPALAVPIKDVEASATVETGAPGAGLIIEAQDLGRQIALSAAGQEDPLAAAAGQALAYLRIAEPDWRLVIHSTIPMASGLGSGAAVSAAIMRALAAAAGQDLGQAALSAMVYEVEELYHGTPSGVDNTVIAYEEPVYFVRGQTPERFAIGRPFTLVIADSGVASPTRLAVGDVRRNWQASPEHYESLFDQIGAIVRAARAAIAAGSPEELGPLMNANQALLEEIGVSSAELDRLVGAARAAGAGGAKLSGGGRGGNMIALAHAGNARDISAALRQAGAKRVIVTTVGHGDNS
jgi:mevalonate kinase